MNVAHLVTLPFSCPNCDRLVADARLFCSDLCRDEAKFVRYFRACAADGRLRRPDVEEALNTRLALILGGGYPERQRQVSKDLRAAVIARDAGRCQACGQPGSQIDHIRGSSDDPDNLQLLCAECHGAKTRANFKPLVPDEHPEMWEKRQRLMERANAAKPIRTCDHPEWNDLWRSVLSRRRAVIRSLES